MHGAREESNLSPRDSLGVVDSLKVGFEIVGRHWGVILLPIGIDLWLWWGPRFSILPLVEQMSALMNTSYPGMDLETVRQAMEGMEALRQFAGHFNLFSLLSILPLLQVPTLLVHSPLDAASPLGTAYVASLKAGFPALLLAGGILSLGLCLGVIYLVWLARTVRTIQEETPVQSKRTGLFKLTSLFLFLGGFLFIGLVVFPLWLLLIGVLTLFSPTVGAIAWLLTVVTLIYIALHLLFVIPGVLVGGRGLFRATWESFVLIQTQFPSVVGLLLLSMLIYHGLKLIWSLPTEDSWALLVGVIGNACVATGLTAGLFVFYQERVKRLSELLPVLKPGLKSDET